MSQKNVNKFLAGAVTATMVATAVVTPAMAASFTDTGKLPEQIKGEVDRAVELGYFQDSEKFNPAASITRGQVALVIARQVSGVAANDIAGLKAYVAKHGLEEKVTPFADVKKGETELYYSSLIVKDAGAFTQDSLNPASNITRSQMAKVVVTAFDLKMNEDNKKEITDIDKVSNKEYIEILASNGVTEPQNGKFNPGNNVTRSQMASFLVRAHDGVNEEAKIESVKAINAKTIEVKFNTAVEAVAADFTVNKGTVKANVSSVALSEDKKTATIELASKLTEGEYTVSVAQKDAEALKGSVKVENEKVSKLEIASDVAPVTGVGASTATVGAQVLNQYGEDITKLNHSDVTVTVGGAATAGTLNSEGVLTLTLVPLAKEGESIYITLVHAKTGVSTQATVKVSNASAVSEVAFGELYNKDGKALNQDTDFSKDKFYLPVTAKDQYGKEITDVTKLNAELVITNTNPAVALVNTTVKSVKINNKDVNVVEVTGTNLAGTSNLIAVSKTTGANTTTTLKVEAGVKVASLAVNSPQELVTAGKDVLFPLTVIDTAGNELKTKKEYDALNAKDNITLSAGASVVEVKDKGLFVKVLGTGVVKDNPITIVITSSTGKVSTQTVIPKEAAKATVITGLSDKVLTSLRAGDTTGVTIKNTDLVVEDQFGQVIKDNTVLSGILFEVTADPNTVFTITDPSSDEKSYKVVATSPINPDVKSSKLSFKIKESGTAVESSTFTKTFTVVEDSQFASYEVEDVKTIYAAEGDGTSGKDKGKFYVDAAYNQDIVVKAKTSSGEVVELTEGTDFTVVGQPADDAEVKFAKDAKEAKKTVTITINRTGEQLTKELTYSNVAPEVVDFIFTATSSLDADKAKALNIDLSATGGTFAVADLHTAKAKIVTTDQYGLKAFTTAIDTLTIVPADASKLTVTNNGTATAQVTAVSAETSFTAKVKIEGVTKEIKVNIAP